MNPAAPFEERIEDRVPGAPGGASSDEWLGEQIAAAQRAGGETVLWVEPSSPLWIARRAPAPGLLAMVTPPPLRSLTVADLPLPPASFDVVVLSHVLTAVRSIDELLERVASLLPPGGLVLVEELCWERLDLETGRWFFGFQDAIARERRCRVSRRLLADRLNDWRAEHAGLRTGASCAQLLEGRFEVQSIEHGPQLGRLLEWEQASDYERLAIDAGVIQATGLRFAGRSANLACHEHEIRSQGVR